MSLLVHELVIGTGTGTATKTNLQSVPNSVVSLASLTVSHPNPVVQVAHIPQKVVTITSNHARTPIPEKGSKLANALAGNHPYLYSTSSQNNVKPHMSSQRPVSHVLYSTSQSNETVRPIKSFSSKTYVLPFVLQDHNYGAPPPPTPPMSPTHSSPVPTSTLTSSPQIHSYKVHQIVSSNTNATGSHFNKMVVSSPCKQADNNKHYIRSPEESVSATVSKVAYVQVSSTWSNGDTVTSNSPVVSLMANMPLHRQQFMPQPKIPFYPSLHIPPPNTTIPTSSHQATSQNLGNETDDDSRVSERSSSRSPSGEETETAPEADGDEQIQLDDSITRCICSFTHDDGYMIQCDRCFVWQHVDCMEIDRNNIPDEYLCEACQPRLTDKNKARALQIRRRQEIRTQINRHSSSDSEDNFSVKAKTVNKIQERKVFKKKRVKLHKANIRASSRRQLSNSKNSSKANTTISLLSSKSNATNNAKIVDEIKSIKRKRQNSYCGVNSNAPSEDGSNTLLTPDKIREWIQDYEIAVTNHYSPELRAKIHASKINGISPEFRESTQGALLGHRCRIAPVYDATPETIENKILVAATRLKCGTAIIEYQGKYALKSQWGNFQTPPNLPYLPFVLQYEMQKEGLSICVDARTYGNDARFARRAHKYNAEIKHVVERGSVHLYIVACTDIEEEDEIMLSLDTAVCLRASLAMKTVPVRSPETSAKTQSPPRLQIKEETNKIPLSHLRKNGIVQSKKSLKKPLLNLSLPQSLGRMSRRSTFSENCNSSDRKSDPLLHSPPKERRTSFSATVSKSPSKPTPKAVCKSPSKTVSTTTEEESCGESPLRDHSDDRGLDPSKMTREERKIMAYMKAFERMEKAAQKRQGTSEKRKDDNKKDKETSSLRPERKPDKDRKRRKSSRGSPRKTSLDTSDEYKSGDSSDGERIKVEETSHMSSYGSPTYSGSPAAAGFRFPKTKKALMNEWLNETIDPVLHSSPAGGEVAAGVPTCYMRSPATPLRKATSCGFNFASEVDSRSAKKRWLRQAIIDGGEPASIGGFFCSSPNSRPDSPTGNGIDYITPLKKRRLARESMSSEQSNTPPSTPYHNSFEEKYEEMELYSSAEENFTKNEESKDEVQIEILEALKKEEEMTEEEFDSKEIVLDANFIKKEIKLEDQDIKLTPSRDLITVEVTKDKPMKVPVNDGNADSYKIKKKKRIKVKSKGRKLNLKKSCVKISSKQTKKNHAKFNDVGSSDELFSNEAKILNIIKDKNANVKVEFESSNANTGVVICSKISPKNSELNISTQVLDKVVEPATISKAEEAVSSLESKSHPEVTSSVEVKEEISSTSGEHSTSCLAKSNDDSDPPEIEDPLKEDQKESYDLAAKPAPVKRKLSILEYRKRKSISCDESKDETKFTNTLYALVDTEEPVQPPPLPSQEKEIASNDLEMNSEEIPPENHIVPEPLNGTTPPVSMSGKGSISSDVEEDENEVKWNEEPTLLELQRENLTERLRKNFGLRVNGNNRAKFRFGITDRWRNLGKTHSGSVGISSSESGSDPRDDLPEESSMATQPLRDLSSDSSASEKHLIDVSTIPLPANLSTKCQTAKEEKLVKSPIHLHTDNITAPPT